MIARALWAAWAAAALLLLLPAAASAQKMCDQVRTNITSAPAAIAEKVSGVPNKRIYLCGYMIVHNGSAAGPDLSFEVSSGTGTNCSIGKTLIIPKMALPAAGALINRIAYTAEKTAPGAAVCLEVFGSGTSLVSSFYWTQF